MKPDFKKLDEIDFVVAYGNPTAEETKEFSEFLRKNREKANGKEKRLTHVATMHTGSANRKGVKS